MKFHWTANRATLVLAVVAVAAVALAAPAAGEAKTFLYMGKVDADDGSGHSPQFSFKLVKKDGHRRITDVDTGGLPEFCYDNTGYAFDWGWSFAVPHAQVTNDGRFSGMDYRPTGDPNVVFLRYVRGSFSRDGKTASGQLALVNRGGEDQNPDWYADCSSGFLNFSAEYVGPASKQPPRPREAARPKGPAREPAKASGKTIASYAGKVVDDGFSGFTFDVVERDGKRTIENVRLDGPATIWCDDENDFRNGVFSPYLKPRLGGDDRFKDGAYHEDSFNTRFDYIQGELSQHRKLATGVFAIVAKWSDSAGNAYACTSGLSFWRADRVTG
jgi:hypothetical protein